MKAMTWPVSILLAARLTLALALPIMGTEVRFYVPPATPQTAVEAAYGAMREDDRLFSDWRDDSELARVNAAAFAAGVTVSPRFAGLTALSLDLARRSGGAFDPTFAPLYRAWPFRADVTAPPPPAAATLRAARRRVGYAHVTFDAARRTVRFTQPGVELGFGAIAKGRALDDAGRALAAHGVRSYAVELGGQWLVAGSAERIALRDPFGRPATVTVELATGSLATSAGYEKRLWIERRWVGHILDPRTGRPAEGVAAVAAYAPDATLADGLSTALFVLGPGEGAALLRAYPGTGARWVMDDGRVVMRGAFPRISAAPTSPTDRAPRARRN